MRERLNENPIVQAAVIGVLALGVAFLLLTRVAGGGSSEPAPAPESSSTGGETVAGVPATDAAGAAAAAGVASDAIGAGDAEAALEAATGAAAGGFEAGPGLPAKVVGAYEDGKAVALLLTRKAGFEDRRLRSMGSRIESVGDVVVLHSYARDVAEYSRITGGVDVSRVPALVVIRPRSESESGVPVASVSYGFRGPVSAEQAVRDALYEGREDLPYHPYPEKR
ncbi:MAG TPA: hypothetical protein VK919_07830 [Solirubrobacterales bacterium]|nr:hypothetical protein [Solirubrobacterales bacterium]